MANTKCRWQSPEDWSEWSEWPAAGLHARHRWRLPVLLMGILFAYGRRDLRCPFGCRQYHRRECSRQRSTAYYRTATGKRKKNYMYTLRSFMRMNGDNQAEIERFAGHIVGWDLSHQQSRG